MLWPEDRIAHIAAHGVTPEEVEEACFGRTLALRAKSRGRHPVYYVLGQTTAGSIRELAEFWDSHDVTDFADELEEVGEPVFSRRPTTAVRVPLSADEIRALREIAASRGVEEAAVIREWVREKLPH